MPISKVVYKSSEQDTGTVWMDTTDKTVTSGAMLSGTTALKNDGSTVTGDIASKSSSDLTVSGATVTAPAGHYASSASKSVASGTAGTPTATKGTVSNHSVTVTPSVTNTTGYITGGAKTGTAVTVNVAELESGTKSITENGEGISVSGYSSVDVAVPIPPSIDIVRLDATENGTYTAPSGQAYSPVVVDVSGGGGTTVEESDVNFIDYDGTIVYSYTKAEFAQLDALPANPSHTGLTAQGWNWTLSNAKTYVASYGRLWIGQMYVTSDGKTRIYIRLEEGRLSPTLGLAVNGTATVEWGDGSANSTVTGTSTSTVINTQHNYAAGGDYVIAVSVSGSMALVGSSSYGSQVLWKNSTTSNQNRVYQNAIQKVEIGADTSIGGYAFYYCYSLQSVTIPSSVTSISTYAFYYCYSLQSVTIPSSVTSIGNYAFRACYSLQSVTIPSGVTSIGNYAFYTCYSLQSVTIPSGVTSIGTNAFYSCYSLHSVTIPSGVTSIGDSAFYYCYSLVSITIPSEVTSIGTSAFSSCYGLGEIHFQPATPPAVSNSNAWTGLPTDCIIYVPSGKLADYTSATNYPDPNTYTYMEEAA